MNRPLLDRATLGLCAAAASLSLTAGSQAQSADALIDKLLEKGILSADEAKELRVEADQGFTKAYQVKSGMPEWVTSLKINGDFRGRFEGFYSDNPAFVDRNRFRYRLRLGVTATLKDQLEVGVRLGSGDLEGIRDLRTGTDPISGNQTFQNNASKKGVFLDLAYAEWSPLNTTEWSGNLTIGKMENPFVFSDAVFDHDYTPEGVGLGLVYRFSQDHSLALNAGGFVLDEISADSDDPHLVGAQLRWNAKWSPRIASTAGAGAMVIGGPENLRNGDVPNINAGNTRTPLPDGALVYNYNPVVVDAAITYTLPQFPLYHAPFPIRLGGDYIHNPAAAGPQPGFLGRRYLRQVRQARALGSVLSLQIPGGRRLVRGTRGFGFRSVLRRTRGRDGLQRVCRRHQCQGPHRPGNLQSVRLSHAFAHGFPHGIDRRAPAVDPGVDDDSQMVRVQLDAQFKF